MTDSERAIYVAIKDADDKFESDGATGTKCWIRDYLLPTFERHGLKIVRQEQKEIVTNGIDHSCACPICTIGR